MVVKSMCIMWLRIVLFTQMFSPRSLDVNYPLSRILCLTHCREQATEKGLQKIVEAAQADPTPPENRRSSSSWSDASKEVAKSQGRTSDSKCDAFWNCSCCLFWSWAVEFSGQETGRCARLWLWYEADPINFQIKGSATTQHRIDAKRLRQRTRNCKQHFGSAIIESQDKIGNSLWVRSRHILRILKK